MFNIRRIDGSLGSWACGLGGDDGEIPLLLNVDPNWLSQHLGQCQAGSLTGAVASQKVTEAPKGSLRLNGNQPLSVKAQGSLTARLTSRPETKVGLSDPHGSVWKGRGLSDKSYPGDNRLILPMSSYRRQGLAPRCRLVASWD